MCGALRYTSYNALSTYITHKARRPLFLSHVPFPLSFRSKKTLDTRNDRVAQYGESNYFQRRSLVNGKASNQTRAASEMTRYDRDVISSAQHYVLPLCIYIRMSAKRDASSRAFNRFAMSFGMNTHGLYVFSFFFINKKTNKQNRYTRKTA